MANRWTAPFTAAVHNVPVADFLRPTAEETRRRLNALLYAYGPWRVRQTRDEYGRVTTCTEGWRAK